METSLTILIGTMTGTAELVAEELRDELARRGITAALKPMDALDETVFAGGGDFLVCTSTYGQGDVPDNARDFFERLEAARPDLSGVRFGLIALGDSTYDTTYCEGGRRFGALLVALGAQQLGEPLLHDASAGTVPEEVALAWIGPWADAAQLPRRAA